MVKAQINLALIFFCLQSLSFLSFDLVGLIYYLILKNDSIVDEKIFKKKNLFRGKVGIFEIKNNKINHILNFYKIENGEFKKIF